MPSDSKPVFTRPTSPHLSIYRWQISSVLSIFHRISGMALAFGSAVMVAWLAIAAYAPADYGHFHDIISSLPGQICMIGWTAAFYYHFCNGIRHLFWDIGKGFALPTMARSGWAVVFVSLFMTVCTWSAIYSGAGH